MQARSKDFTILDDVDAVALAATIGGSAVGLAGVGATAWSNWLQQGTARDLASKQHEHERALARGPRLFDRREPVYAEMLRLVEVWRRRVDAILPFWRHPGDPGPPEPPDFDQWQDMLIRLRTIGSPAVADGFRAFFDAVSDFARQVDTVQEGIDGVIGVDLIAERVKLDEARAQVAGAIETLQRTVSDELAAL